ncbi:MAG: hypothetical protein AAFY74_17550 [Pseudomonadota bacterium]
MTEQTLTEQKLVKKAIAILRAPKTQTYALGVIGWIIVLNAMPFDWALPAYAEF